MIKKISLLGCTGSVGRQVVEVVKRYPDRFRIVALAANEGGRLFFEQAKELAPEFAALRSNGGEDLPLPAVTRFERGEQAFEEACAYPSADVVFVAVSGFAGLKAALLALSAGKDVALANKECLVAGGHLVNAAAAKAGAKILPVDSEHSAVWQALGFDRRAPFEKIILTASGGALRDVPKEKLSQMTAKEALAHPTWKMGDKITVDCATMLNKGYEVMEAMSLYGVPLEKVSVVMHRESIVHSMVAFADGAVLTQMSYPSMELPIQIALTYPERIYAGVPALDLAKLGALHFSEPDPERYPCFSLALACAREGGDAPCTLIGAGEAAVRAFLRGQIKFTQIAQILESTLCRAPRGAAGDYAHLCETEARARETAETFISRYGD